MVKCCILNCDSGQRSNKKLRFFRIPSKTIVHSDTERSIKKQQHILLKNKRSNTWMNIINRFDLNDNSRVCSLHFFSGKPSHLKDVNCKYWAPHIKIGQHDRENVASGETEQKVNARKSYMFSGVPVLSAVDNLLHIAAKAPMVFDQSACPHHIYKLDNQIPGSEGMVQLNQTQHGNDSYFFPVESMSSEEKSFTFESPEAPMAFDPRASSDHIYQTEYQTADSQKKYMNNLFHNMPNPEPHYQFDETGESNELLTIINEQSGKIKIIEKKLEEVECNSRINDEMLADLKEIVKGQNSLIDVLKSKLETSQHNESAFKNDDKRCRYYTGVNFAILSILYTRLEEILPSHGNRKINKFQSLILTLMRLRLGCHFVDLGYRFNISYQTASKVFHEVLFILYFNLKQLIVWPERDVVRSTMPKIFLDRLGHNRLVCTIDCFEVFVECPFDPLEYCQLWSTYKHHETIKYLIGKTPQGSVSYISQAYVGRTSDKQIVNDCGILDLIMPGDFLAADRGFTIEDELSLRNANLLIPTIVQKGQTQLHPEHIEFTRQLASLRIHIERIICLVRRKYRFFSLTVPISALHKETNNVAVVDQMVTVACALINLCKSVVDASADDDF